MRGLNLLSNMSSEPTTLLLMEAIAIKKSVTKESLCMLPHTDGSEANVFGNSAGLRQLEVANRIVEASRRELEYKYMQKDRYKQKPSKVAAINRDLNNVLKKVRDDLPQSRFQPAAKSYIEDDVEDLDRETFGGSKDYVTAVIRQNAKRVNIRPSGPFEAEVAELKQVVDEMLVEEFGENPGYQLPQGGDGLPSPFLADPAVQFNYSRAVSIFTERELRTTTVCNAGKVGDDNQSWRTHYLNACYFVIKNRGTCALTGLPMTNEVRMPHRMSFGHIIHGENMLSGWSSPRPTSLKHFNSNKVNVQPETWAANEMKSDFLGEFIEDFRRLLQRWIIKCRNKFAFWEL